MGELFFTSNFNCWAEKILKLGGGDLKFPWYLNENNNLHQNQTVSQNLFYPPWNDHISHQKGKPETHRLKITLNWVATGVISWYPWLGNAPAWPGPCGPGGSGGSGDISGHGKYQTHSRRVARRCTGCDFWWRCSRATEFENVDHFSNHFRAIKLSIKRWCFIEGISIMHVCVCSQDERSNHGSRSNQEYCVWNIPIYPMLCMKLAKHTTPRAKTKQTVIFCLGAHSKCSSMFITKTSQHHHNIT